MCIAVEYEIFAHITTAHLANALCVSFYSLNTCVFKFFRIHVLAKRMSGDMNTSLGNGITNLITIMYLCWKKFKFILTAIVVEGDDSLFRLPAHCKLDESDFASLGLNTKIEYHNRLATAGFCGAIFHEADLKNLVDPGRILRRFGYVDNKYHNARHSKKMGLLRAYGFSIYYQYHGCPIVESLARYLLRVTRGYHAIKRSINQFKFAEGETLPLSEQQMYELFPPNEIGVGSREVVSSMYGFSLDEQVWCEEYIDAKNKLEPLHMPLVISKSHEDTRTYFNSCSVSSHDDATHVTKPPKMKFYALVKLLNQRLKHLELRHRKTIRKGLPYGAEGPFCSCGSNCNYWNDLLYDLRKPLGLKPQPRVEYHEHTFDSESAVRGLLTV